MAPKPDRVISQYMDTLYPLQCRTIEGAATGPHLLITAGVHGDEFEGMEAARKLTTIVDSRRLRGRVTLVPVANEPAYMRGERTAEDGVDLARCCPGSADGSVTEQIAYALAQMIRSANFYIDLHSGGVAMQILPLVGYMLHDDPQVLAAQRRMARAFNIPLIWGTSPSLVGRSISVARDAGIPAIYAEYFGGGMNDRRGVDLYVEGCLNVMRELGMLECPVPPSRVCRIVEDLRRNSGHLQIGHPSPISGIFCAAVELGREVQAGETIGSVSDHLTDSIHEIYAEHAGLVICLASFARVQQGAPLAVVLQDQGSALSA